MFLGEDFAQLVFLGLVAAAVGGVALVLLMPLLTSGSAAQRVKAISEGKKGFSPPRKSFAAKLLEGGKDNRRKQIEESVRQIEQTGKKERAKRLSLRAMIAQAGLDFTPRVFWLMSFGVGVVVILAALVLGMPIYVALPAGFVGMFGLPRWLLGFLRRRRQNVFLDDFADAIDVMVRGLRSGLPISDAMRIIAGETGPPVGPEFIEVIEGQRIGLTIDQGIERMYERVPLAEVRFLGIVIAIQSKAGGNLSEALSNLSKVLRDRKRMKAKIRSASQEAKSSAAIIGSMPILLLGFISWANPTYMDPMYSTMAGNLMLVGSGIWMVMGILVMKKMINFDI